MADHDDPAALAEQPPAHRRQRRRAAAAGRAGDHERRSVEVQVDAERDELVAADTDQRPARSRRRLLRRGRDVGGLHPPGQRLHPHRQQARVTVRRRHPRPGLCRDPLDGRDLPGARRVEVEHRQLRLDRVRPDQRTPGRHVTGHLPRGDAGQGVVGGVGHPQHQPVAERRARAAGEQAAVAAQDDADPDPGALPDQAQQQCRAGGRGRPTRRPWSSPSQPSTSRTSQGSRSAAGRCGAAPRVSRDRRPRAAAAGARAPRPVGGAAVRPGRSRRDPRRPRSAAGQPAAPAHHRRRPARTGGGP